MADELLKGYFDAKVDKVQPWVLHRAGAVLTGRDNTTTRGGRASLSWDEAICAKRHAWTSRRLQEDGHDVPKPRASGCTTILMALGSYLEAHPRFR